MDLSGKTQTIGDASVRVLVYMYKNKRWLTATDVAQALGEHRHNTWQIINRMRKREYVERKTEGPLGKTVGPAGRGVEAKYRITKLGIATLKDEKNRRK